MDHKRTQPKLKIQLSSTDMMIEYFCILMVVLHFGAVLYYYPSLSDSIPLHFDHKGEPDGFGSKTSLWLLVAMATGLYILLTYLNNVPHHFNYLTKITPENAIVEYSKALKMMRFTKVAILISTLYILSIAIKNGLGHQTNLGKWFTPAFIIIMTAPIFWMMSKTSKTK